MTLQLLVEQAIRDAQEAEIAVQRAVGHVARAKAKQTLRRRQIRPGYPVSVPFPGPDEANAYLSDPRLVCLLCGKDYDMLAKHLRDTHGVTADQYRAAYRLPWTHGLAGTNLAKEKSRGLRERLADPQFFSHWFANADQHREDAHERATTQREQPFRQELIGRRLEKLGRGPWSEAHFHRLLELMKQHDLLLKDVAGRVPDTPSYATAVKWFNSTPARKQLLVGAVHQLSPRNQAIARMLSSAVIERVKALAGDGRIHREIAAETGLHIRAVGKILRESTSR